MTETKRRTIIAGNWKMYKTIGEATSFIQELSQAIQDLAHPAYLAVPFTAIHSAANTASPNQIVIGAQNMNDATEGAFTGEIAGKMLKDAGARFVILGHSERRHVFAESSLWINKKVKRALEDDLEPILCIGETIDQRKANKTEEVLKIQLQESLAGITAAQLQKMIIAYEPVWAIGTGLTATPEQAQEMHAYCRKVIAENWDTQTAEMVPILYGGSVKPENAMTLMEQPDIDGLLIGGASLKVESLARIINDQKLCTTKGKS